MPGEHKRWRESATSCVQDRTWGRGLLTEENSRKLLWTVNATYSPLLPVHHSAVYSNMELKTRRHSTGLGRSAVHTPHVAKSGGREFQPHCEISPHMISAVQPWFTSKCLLLISFTALKSTEQVPCWHWHVFTSWSLSPSLPHVQREGKSVCLCGQG